MKAKSILVMGYLCLLLCAGRTWADLSAGLVAYFPFAGSADDASGNGHHGTAYGATLSADRFGNTNSAYSFDGVNDYINVPYATAFQLSAFTLAAWVCPEGDLSAGSRGVAIAARGEDGTTDRLWSSFEIVGEQNRWGTGVTLLYENNADSECVYDTGLYPQAQSWTHIAATRSLAGAVTIYIDGIAVGQWDDTPPPSTLCTRDMTIGARWYSPGGSGPYELTNFFSGLIDEVRLYDRPLSAAEIRELAVVPIPGAALLGMLGLGYAGMRLRRQAS